MRVFVGGGFIYTWPPISFLFLILIVVYSNYNNLLYLAAYCKYFIFKQKQGCTYTFVAFNFGFARMLSSLIRTDSALFTLSEIVYSGHCPISLWVILWRTVVSHWLLCHDASSQVSKQNCKQHCISFTAEKPAAAWTFSSKLLTKHKSWSRTELQAIYWNLHPSLPCDVTIKYDMNSLDCKPLMDGLWYFWCANVAINGGLNLEWQLCGVKVIRAVKIIDCRPRDLLFLPAF